MLICILCRKVGDRATLPSCLYAKYGAVSSSWLASLSIKTEQPQTRGETLLWRGQLWVEPGASGGINTRSLGEHIVIFSKTGFITTEVPKPYCTVILYLTA